MSRLYSALNPLYGAKPIPNTMSKSAREAFAEAYLDIYREAVEEYKNTNFWNFKLREKLKQKMRWSQHHYKKLTGKQVTLE